jgi:hypothetical protein
MPSYFHQGPILPVGCFDFNKRWAKHEYAQAIFLLNYSKSSSSTTPRQQVCNFTFYGRNTADDGKAGEDEIYLVFYDRYYNSIRRSINFTINPTSQRSGEARWAKG